MKFFKKSVAPTGYKNKQAVSRRRYLARVLSSLMYRYALRQSASVPRFLYPAKGYGIISLTFNLQNNNIRTFHIIGEVVHSSGGKSQDLWTENGIGDILHDAGGLAVAQCHVCADRIEDDAL